MFAREGHKLQDFRMRAFFWGDHFFSFIVVDLYKYQQKQRSTILHAKFKYASQFLTPLALPKTSIFHISSKISAKAIEKKCNVITFICSTFPTRARWSMFLAPLPIRNSTSYINHKSCDCPVLWAKKKRSLEDP